METYKTKRNLKSIGLIKNYIENGYYDLAVSLINKVKNPVTKKRLTALLTASVVAATNAPAMTVSAAELPNERIASTQSADQVKAFGDVSQNNWAHDYIYKLVGAGVINGYPDGTFRPNATITRAEFNKMLVSAIDMELTNSSSVFKDVKDTYWAKNYIMTAYENRLVYDDSTSLFRPNEAITREDVAYGSAKAVTGEFTEYGFDLPFTDENCISDYCTGAVSLAVAEEIVNGYPDGTFKPKKSITRAEASKIIANTMEVMFETELAMPEVVDPSIPILAADETYSEWYLDQTRFSYVLEQCNNVTKRFAYSETVNGAIAKPLTGDEDWGIWIPVRNDQPYVNCSFEEALAKGLIKEEMKYVSNENYTGNVYRYKQNVEFVEATVYYYEFRDVIKKNSVAKTETEKYLAKK